MSRNVSSYIANPSAKNSVVLTKNTTNVTYSIMISSKRDFSPVSARDSSLPQKESRSALGPIWHPVNEYQRLSSIAKIKNGGAIPPLPHTSYGMMVN
jgi:hypothetical protein